MCSSCKLEGTKHWRVWGPTEQSVDPVGGKHRLPQPKVDELGEPEMDLVLEPGDVLYLPRGHPHVAETTDCSSAHLTVGLLAITWHRVVRRSDRRPDHPGRATLIDPAVDSGVDPGFRRLSECSGELE